MEYTEKELDRAIVDFGSKVLRRKSNGEEGFVALVGVGEKLQALANRQAAEIAVLKRMHADSTKDADARIAEVLKMAEVLKAEKDAAERKLAVLFDSAVYGDSYGVEGSDFLICRWCGGGSSPGKGDFKHNDGCLFDDDVLEKKVQEHWGDQDTEMAVKDAVIAAQAERLRKIEEMLHPGVVFSGGRYADRCHWCRRDLPDYPYPEPVECHDADCAYLAWLSVSDTQEGR